MRELYGYYRSSAAFRVRIALALKALDYDYVAIDLKPAAKDHKKPEYLARNPQGRVPFLIDGEVALAQSPAILEYLEEQYPAVPLLPADTADRAWVRQLVNIIACDIHPLNNLSVLQTLKNDFSADQDGVNRWYHKWIIEGFAAIETLLKREGRSSPYCFGDQPGMADVYLVPQVWNAIRFDTPLGDFPTIMNIYARCTEHPAFAAAMPENQPDAPLDQ